MPELPEVEFAAGQLRRWMEGRRVERAVAPKTRVLREQTPAAFSKRLSGRVLERVERRGKYLLLQFEGDAGLLAHLGMTGKLTRQPSGEAVPYSRGRFELEDGFAVHLRDPRMFGRLTVARFGELLALPEIRKLGPDAKEPEVTARVLRERLGESSRPIKVALMDQEVLAGLGNIHAAEALYRARIDPRRPAHSLEPGELKRLANAILKTIDFALAQVAGEEEIDYVEEPGTVNPFLVYGRAGETCRRCGGTVQSMVQGGRTTHFCPGCQR